MSTADKDSRLTESVEDARAKLVAARDASPERWRELIEQHLAHAYTTGDIDELAATVQFMTYLLDMEGRFEEALAEVGHALRLASEPCAARALLLTIEASLLSALGNHDRAIDALVNAEDVVSQLGAAAPLKCQVLAESVRLQLLHEPSRRLESLIQSSLGHQAKADHLFLLSWYVPWLAARGRCREATPVLRQLRIQAEAGEHRWRRTDAKVFDAWMELLGSNLSEPAAGRGPNAMASWRLACLRLWSSSLSHDLLVCQDRLRELALARPRLGTADVGSSEAWDSWLEVLSGGLPSAILLPPNHLSLANLPAALVSAQTVALAGSAADARVWLRWATQTVVDGTESSLEWPVSLRRIGALLTLRVGRRAEARRLLSGAAEWAAAAGYLVEAAIARLQLAELSSAGPSAASDPWLGLASAARSELIDLGVDPLPHAHAVVVSLRATGKQHPSVLTPRELEVLRTLAKGLTYREVGAELGIVGPTVQSFAHKIYEKLGASGRHQAVVRAQELGLL